MVKIKRVHPIAEFDSQNEDSDSPIIEIEQERKESSLPIRAT